MNSRIRTTDRVRLLALVALVMALSGCSSGGHWVGDDVEAVGGFWVMEARPCDDAGCLPARQAAQIAIGDRDGKSVSKASAAVWTRDFAYDDGRPHLSATSGAIGVMRVPVILDLVDGTRRLVPLVCANSETVPVVLSDCQLDDGGHWYNAVGHEPWTQPRPNSL